MPTKRQIAIQKAAEVVYRKRTEFGYSLREFARLTNMKFSTLRNFEANCSEDVKGLTSNSGNSFRLGSSVYKPLLKLNIWTEIEFEILEAAIYFAVDLKFVENREEIV